MSATLRIITHASGDKYPQRLSNERRTNSSGLPIFASNSFVGCAATASPGPRPLFSSVRQAIVDRAVHLVLRLEIREAEHRPARRHDARVRIGQRLQPLQAADDAADPAAGGVVDDGPALARDRVTHREHVLLREVHVQIAVGVRRIRDVPVANARSRACRSCRRSCSAARSSARV